MDVIEILIGITEIAVALAGFTGVVVAFGSRSRGAWHPGDRLRLTFLLEASLTAAGFALLGLLLASTELHVHYCWMVCSITWVFCMVISLINSRGQLRANQATHGDIDRLSNRLTAALFMIMIGIQLCNAIYWQEFAPFLAALILNLAGAAMQFTRLIRTAFQG